MPEQYQETRIWRATLAPGTAEDTHRAERERLRSSFVNFRARVALLAAEIHRSLPDYTVHDITHLDALWEIAELVAGPSFEVTPTEAYVLGGAFLLHDLGMGLASYPGGLADLRSEQSWSDLAVKEFTAQFHRSPMPTELRNLPRDIEERVVANLLRLLHARHAETLATTAWRLGDSDTPQFLIEDTELRQAFGRTIGRVAHSHWWPIYRLDDEFSRTLGAPHWCPRDWTVDPLKLACLLRLADASHIDARRAPPFLRRIRRPGPYSDEHWQFQEYLQKPQAADDALVFTSGHAFRFSEAAAWWLCLDTLNMIDRELRGVDALLADRKLERFATRRVAGVDSPERLVAYIPTDGWLPVNAALQVSDLPRVIETLGGTELYGRDLRVPLRELIQNATDAIRARRIVDQRAGNWGVVTVVVGRDEDVEWLEVRDSGIGMSREVLTRHLLDFGTTYWGSTLMVSEFPGLLTSGFRATGKYGIGFFSTFMLGERVRVTTRRFDVAQADTMVLEFSSGVSGRPILRPATEKERLRDGGTTVRVWLRRPAAHAQGLLGARRDTERRTTLAAMCAQIAPCIDVDVKTEEFGVRSVVVTADDWLTISGAELLRRTHDWDRSSTKPFEDVTSLPVVAALADRIRSIEDDTQVYGRLAVVPDWHHVSDVRIEGVVTVGGLVSTTLRRMVGVLVGSSTRAARDVGRPLVPAALLATWATEQAKLVHGMYDERTATEIAQTIWACGGDTGPLPIGRTKEGFRTWSQVVEDFRNCDEVLIGVDFRAKEIVELVPDATFVDNIVFVSSGVYFGVAGIHLGEWWPIDIDERWGGFDAGWKMASGVGAIIAALSVAWAIPVPQLGSSDSHHAYRELRAIARAGAREFTAIVDILTRIPRTNDLTADASTTA